MVRSPGVIVLGLDGLDAAWTERRIADGRLPGLAALAARSGVRRLIPTWPPQSPVVWASVVTGVEPGRHGVFDFIHRRRGTYDPLLSMAGDAGRPALGEPALWARAAAAGRPSQALFAPLTYPVPPGPGRVLAGLGAPDAWGTQGLYGHVRLGPDVIDPGPACRRGAASFEWSAPIARPSRIALPLPGADDDAHPGSEAPGGPALPLRLVPLDRGREVEVQVGELATLRLEVGGVSRWLACPADGRDVLIRFALSRRHDELHLYITPPHRAPWDGGAHIASPATWAADLADSSGPFPTMGWSIDTWARKAEIVDEETFIELASTVFEARRRLFERALDRFADEGGLLFALFELTDRAMHVLYHGLDERHPRHDPVGAVATRERLDALVRRADRLVRRALEALAPDDALIVLSDHGFAPYRVDVDLNAVLHQAGWLVPEAGPDPLDGRGAGGRPIPTSLGGAGARPDMARTRAFSMGMGKVWLNLRARDPQGTVGPGREYFEVRRQVQRDVLALRDGGRPVVRAVVPREELYRGSRAVEAPDLVVAFEEGYRASSTSALGLVGDRCLRPNDTVWSGDHATAHPEDVPGLLLHAGPVRWPRGRVYAAQVGATVLDMLGIPLCEKEGADR